MVTTIGTFEAKEQLSQLLDRVAGGETITITRHGRPIAKLIPVTSNNREAARLAVSEWKSLRAGNSLGKDLTIHALRKEGRK